MASTAIATTLTALADSARAAAGADAPDAWVVDANSEATVSASLPSSDSRAGLAAALQHALSGAAGAGALAAATHVVVSALTPAAGPRRGVNPLVARMPRLDHLARSAGAAAAAVAAFRLVGCAGAAAIRPGAAPALRAAAGAAAGVAAGSVLPSGAARAAAAAALLRLASGCAGVGVAGTAAPRAWDLTQLRWCPPLPTSLPHPGLDGGLLMAGLAALAAAAQAGDTAADPRPRLVGLLILSRRRPPGRRPRPMHGGPAALALASVRLVAGGSGGGPPPRHP